MFYCIKITIQHIHKLSVNNYYTRIQMGKSLPSKTNSLPAGPFISLVSNVSITGSTYSSTSVNKNGNPYLIASSSCFRKSGLLNVDSCFL